MSEVFEIHEKGTEVSFPRKNGGEGNRVGKVTGFDVTSGLYGVQVEGPDGSEWHELTHDELTPINQEPTDDIDVDDDTNDETEDLDTPED